MNAESNRGLCPMCGAKMVQDGPTGVMLCTCLAPLRCPECDFAYYTEPIKGIERIKGAREMKTESNRGLCPMCRTRMMQAGFIYEMGHSRLSLLQCPECDFTYYGEPVMSITTLNKKLRGGHMSREEMIEKQKQMREQENTETNADAGEKNMEENTKDRKYSRRCPFCGGRPKASETNDEAVCDNCDARSRIWDERDLTATMAVYNGEYTERCPFCGSTHVQVILAAGDYARVCCTDCMSRGPHAPGDMYGSENGNKYIMNAFWANRKHMVARETLGDRVIL